MSDSIVGRIIVPLACGALGGVVAFGLSSLATPRAETQPDACKEVTVRVASLESAVNALGVAERPAREPMAEALQPSPETKALAEHLLEEAKKSHEMMESRHAEFEERRNARTQERAEVELVKLKAVQSANSPEQTKVNVTRHLKRLIPSEAEVATVANIAAPYLRERSEALIKILERASTGTKVTQADAEQQLKALDDKFLAALPTTLDEVTRRAVATELRSMAPVPYFLRE